MFCWIFKQNVFIIAKTGPESEQLWEPGIQDDDLLVVGDILLDDWQDVFTKHVTDREYKRLKYWTLVPTYVISRYVESEFRTFEN